MFTALALPFIRRVLSSRETGWIQSTEGRGGDPAQISPETRYGTTRTDLGMLKVFKLLFAKFQGTTVSECQGSRSASALT